MNSRKTLNKIRLRRKKRARAKLLGTAERPRFSIFRSNRYTYAQLIDDQAGRTLVSASTREVRKSERETMSKQKQAEQIGELVAKKAIERGIKQAVFNRGGYKYHGRVGAVAEGARRGGLQF